MLENSNIEVGQILGEKIKQIRLKMNMSQNRFGKYIGVSGKTISAYETGRSVPPLKILEKISTEYQVPVIQVVEGKTGELKTKIENIKYVIQDLEEYIQERLSF